MHRKMKSKTKKRQKRELICQSAWWVNFQAISGILRLVGTMAAISSMISLFQAHLAEKLDFCSHG